MDERHFNYYRRAAEILGFIAEKVDGALKLTERGQEMLGTREGESPPQWILEASAAIRPPLSEGDGEPPADQTRVAGVGICLRRQLSLSVLLASIVPMVTGCQPLWHTVIGVDEVEPQVVVDRLASDTTPLVLDVRDRESFLADHIPQAVSVQLDDLDGFLNSLGPSRSKAVITVCYTGRLSLLAASVVAAHGYTEVASLAGGMGRWRDLGLSVTSEAGATVDHLPPPRVRLTLLEQVAEVIAGFVIKPFYMLLSLLLIVVLRRQRATEIVLLRWGLAAFLAGETACAANYAFLAAPSDGLELVHGLGMVVMNALIPWGILLLVDRRVVRLLDAETPCVALRFCGKCWKREKVGCPAQRMFLFAAPAMMLVALMPLGAPLRPLNVVANILGTDVPMQVSLLLQLVQFRLYPTIAAALFAATTLLLWRGGTHGFRAAQASFFVGLGFLGFSFMRWLLLHVYRSNPAWGDVWEELTELLAILGITLLLWLIRHQYGLYGKREPAS